MIPLGISTLLFLGFILAIFVKKIPMIRVWITINILIFIGLIYAYTILNDGNHPLLSFQGDWIDNIYGFFFLQIDAINLFFLILMSLVFLFIAIYGLNENVSLSHLHLIILAELGLVIVFISQNALLFYLGWELAMVPIYLFLILKSNPLAIKSFTKFFIYTILGSLFMLLAFIYIYTKMDDTASFLWSDVIQISFSSLETSILSIAIGLAFFVKIPVFPFHEWQSKTYFLAPFPITIILSAIMMKMGIFGLIKWFIPIIGSINIATYAIPICVFSAFYGALVAFNQKNLKKILAYASLSHGSMMAAAIFTLSETGTMGGIFQSFSHGIYLSGLFLLVAFFERKGVPLQTQKHIGLAKNNPCLALYFFIIILSSIGVPLTAGFVGELLMLKSLFDFDMWIGSFATLSIVLTAIYMLRVFNLWMLGEREHKDFVKIKLSHVDHFIFISIIFFIFFFGIFPNMMIEKLNFMLEEMSHFQMNNLNLPLQ